MLSIWSEPNARWVMLSCLMLGTSSGILSSFAMLRRRSLLGDALAHASLPGICLAFMVTGTRSLGWFMLGALGAGIIGAFLIQAITRHSRIKEDTALGLVLSVFFAFGIVLLTQILHSTEGAKAGLDKFLFGQAAAMDAGDVRVMFYCVLAVSLISLALYKELKLLCFDPGYADGIGFPSNLLDTLLNLLIVLVVVIGLQAVGVVLMVAMLITPAAAARFWTDRLGRMVVLSGIIGALSGILGTYFSALAPHLSTGPLIVLSATVFFLLSLFLAPRRGLIARGMRLWTLRKQIARENVLRSLYELAEQNGAWNEPFDLRAVAKTRNQSVVTLLRTVRLLEAEELVVDINGRINLTEKGLGEAYRIVRNHRLWEMFLMHEEQIGADHVDRDADFIEHFLPREAVEELETLLKVYQRELRLPPSVHPLEAK